MAGNVAPEDPRAAVQAVPVWFTVNVWPPIVTVSTREDTVVLTGIAIVTLPLPVPAEGVALRRPEAVQGQLELEAETVIKAGPPAAGTIKLEGSIEKEQPVLNC
jgi:hypothetical protein